MVEYKDLSEEQRAKVAGAHTAEDLVRVAHEEGIELTDEQLEQISGGLFGWGAACPECGGELFYYYAGAVCTNCGAEFEY